MLHEIRYYRTASDYWDDVGPFLLQDEAFHSLAIGLAARFIKTDWRPDPENGASGGLLASAWRSDGSFDFAGWWTPPRALTVTGGGAKGLRALLDSLPARGGELTNCNGPMNSIEALAEIADRPFAIEMDTALHRLDTVQWPDRLAQLDVVAATTDHNELIQRWMNRYFIDTGLGPPDSQPSRDPVDLETKQHFLAQDPDGEFVSMALITRETPKSAGISGVYTPDEERGQGYASAIVAEVSQRILDSGKSYSTLFTDLANPTSNKIYHALGYRNIGAFRQIRFEP